MIIKKFTAKTEEEAVAAAHKELGDNVVIMNVRTVNPKGLFGFLRKKQVEATAALEEETIPLRQTVREVAAVVERSRTAETAAAVQPARTAPQPAQETAGHGSNIEQKLENLQVLLEKQAMQPAAETPRKESEKSGQTDDETETEQEKFVRLLYNTMIDNEVDEKYANLILDEVSGAIRPNMPMDYVLANVYQKMILKFGKCELIAPAKQGPKAVFFIGPTGVGKTTTIAKIAAHYAMEEKKSVALLTADTYRIAAAEQLRTYAQILEVPFQVVYNAEELRAAVQSMQSFDYLFVDTAGHSLRNEELLESMRGLLDSVQDLCEEQVFLVLSATTKYSDLVKTADSYRELTPYQLIFTKLDETDALGNLLNVRLHADTPIAYVTCGQNVPDDIEQFNPQKTVKQLLGGKV